MEVFQQFDPDVEPESVGLRWAEYKFEFENFMVAKHGEKLEDIAKELLYASFLHYGGKKISKLIRSGTAVTTYEKAIEKFDKCFVKAVNTDFERFTFSTSKQGRNETFDSFVNRLRVLSTNCIVL